MRVSIEIEDDSNQDEIEREYRVEMFSNQDLQASEVLVIAAEAVSKMYKLKTAAERAAEAERMLESITGRTPSEDKGKGKKDG
ncbi:hypothetical protein PBI_WOES_78 [Gordonia phage Woes]|uniref:Uncharacterized protein n=11 Tax=Woesvirus woes TaxID=1982751 RepID=A0A2H4PG29_9CAUD|nr:hypothetical protein BH793_gp35 [Gordonia phage Woes]ATW61173.1 hypothetical protein SEA_ANAMIKA_78 [Gordonia phage Anamika]AVP43262.1 hypothetical protein PBI_HAIL2PITT_77 [Gordonia phage Hail2Pitt]QAX94361.1 hypothetical protein SEA_GUILLAUME_78 [Gordonia phage Guillaume]QAX94684.1 hypothetical protein SEA_HARAMBE_78 [Gordonia phage Harambe]QAX95347.1 hypothetical protein SEA_HELLO_78 [Gordonia phage Hello]QAX95439.1 hypothetical protein SEA_NEOEVIE_78 [Gordonia phage Neoevie]QBP30355.1